MQVMFAKTTLMMVCCALVAGCGGARYLHLRDGTALECERVVYVEELDGYLAELDGSGAVILVERERVRDEAPISDAAEGGRIVDDADPGDSSRELEQAAGELIEEMVAALGQQGETPSILFMPMENLTPRRFAPEILDRAAQTHVGTGAEAVTGERRRALASSLRGGFDDASLQRTDLDLIEFYSVDWIVLSRIEGAAQAEAEDGSRYRYHLAFRVMNAAGGAEIWSGEREWTVTW